MKRNLLFALVFLFVYGCASPIATEVATITEAVVEIMSTPTPDLDYFDYADPNGQTEWNFLVLGSDYREGDPNRQIPHTDAFILVNVKEGIGGRCVGQTESTSACDVNVNFMPIARDLWLGEEYGVLYSAYSKLGEDGVSAMAEEVFGLKLDAILYTDLDNFELFIDDIGGVKLAVPFAVDDQCGDKHYKLAAGQREVFTGFDLLCLARMRKGYDDGFFTRQEVHAVILQALWEKLREQVTTEPAQLVYAVATHPFVEVWSPADWDALAKLAIRARLSEIDYKVASLDENFLVSGTAVGALADGSIGEFFVHYPSVDLKEWVAEVLK